uniref:Protein kinase domain-containing protein n=1 Tax=Panagrolaimus sp. PS1159 TaxID=55785 RepID=A0AC35GPC6_9BILA
MGRSQSSLRMVYMLDFGLARQYLNAKGEIRSPRSAAGFRGTVRYAAVTAHKNKEMGRSDDLYSFFYIIVEFLQGALPWRKIKDKDEVGRMKEEVNYETLLEGCPPELHEIPTHLKTLGYPDDPDYDMLEKILRGILARLQIHMDDPYDWELGYENISGRSRTTTTTNGNVSTRMKSHTTAVKDRGPEEKNRALDTQAPITMGEDDDEQTGNCYRLPPMNSAHTAGKEFDDRQDKPKYKRQEFMRPKYGAVSFDVIDAVNARLAAASVGEKSSNNDFFNRIRYDTSIENDKINESNNPDVSLYANF